MVRPGLQGWHGVVCSTRHMMTSEVTSALPSARFDTASIRPEDQAWGTYKCLWLLKANIPGEFGMDRMNGDVGLTLGEEVSLVVCFRVAEGGEEGCEHREKQRWGLGGQ